MITQYMKIKSCINCDWVQKPDDELYMGVCPMCGHTCEDLVGRWVYEFNYVYKTFIEKAGETLGVTSTEDEFVKAMVGPLAAEGNITRPVAAEGGRLDEGGIRLDKIEVRLTTIEQQLGLYNVEVVEKPCPVDLEGYWLHYCTIYQGWRYVTDNLLECIHCRVSKYPPKPPEDRVIKEGEISW